jgi:hypothetical protein
MKISVKDLVSKIKDSSSGILAFKNAPNLKITGIDGEEVTKYDELKELFLSEDENKFIKKRWDDMINKDRNKDEKERTNYYDGNVIVVVDVIYDEGENTLNFIMQKTKYSIKSAIQDKEYPRKERLQEFLSFGIGLMGNLIIHPSCELFMVRRSQNVHSEKGAISVPGGEMEYKKDEGKDDVKSGFYKAVKGELIEEVLSPAHKESKFNTKLVSIAYKAVDGIAVGGIDLFFEISPEELVEPITPDNLKKTFKNSIDGKYESTGEFFFVDPSKNISSESKNSPAKVMTNLESRTEGAGTKKYDLQRSGISALSSQVWLEMKKSYERGEYLGLPPNPKGIANVFTGLLPKGEFFDIFDMNSLLKLTISINPNAENVRKSVALKLENEKVKSK